MSVSMLPAEIRQRCRSNQLTTPTSGLAPGYVQANLVILPYPLAFEFLLFCQRNPKPCPVLDVIDAGEFEPKWLAPGADIRTDLPRYNVFRQGELVEETTDIRPLWRDDLVTFLIGCSFSFENALLNAGLPVRHIEEKKNVPMYKTTIDCFSSRTFSSSLVVSMRPLPVRQVVRAVEVTARYHKAHGAPIHISDPDKIGIDDLSRPDYGDAVTLGDDEVPVFWACGVTTQIAIDQAKPEFAITHAPGHMFIGDLKDEVLTA
ncbi:MAG: putative hydro-lyase [Oculatellaceae cyanobacterium bins.114]|nr:putative hydro-lyase [Oculatellaceae cyanobacterium bins.114]